VTLSLGGFTNRLHHSRLTPVLHDGVPDHLKSVLRRWIYNVLLGGRAELVSLKLEIPVRYNYPARDADSCASHRHRRMTCYAS
jgi:hypothetical protein